MAKKNLSDALAEVTFAPVDSATLDIVNTQLGQNRLLDPNNHYLPDPAALIKVEVSASSCTIYSRDIEQYIGASILQHCFDGWNYLSRGVESYIRGDNGVAVHLVYYSELRAVMSIMAAHGIGIFNNKHIYSDGSSSHFFSDSTHNAAKFLFEDWANSSAHSLQLMDIVKIKSKSLREWITASGIGQPATLGLVVKEFLTTWSIDLQLEKDQDLRNEMSYRPQFENFSTSSSRAVGNITEIWNLLEPQPSDRFEKLDLHLFRKSIEAIFQKVTGDPLNHDSNKPNVKRMFQDLGVPISQPLFKFLLRETDPLDHFVLEKAQIHSADERINLTDPIPMICRAVLLLRIASGFTESRFISKVGNKSILDFWWTQRAFDNAIIGDVTEVSDMVDLYADVRDAISDLNFSINSPNKPFHANNTAEMIPLQQFQRACFWGIGL